jgi:hypothetical protein
MELVSISGTKRSDFPTLNEEQTAMELMNNESLTNDAMKVNGDEGSAAFRELQSLELALVGGGSGEVYPH